jgi:hypothetical protein
MNLIKYQNIKTSPKLYNNLLFIDTATFNRISFILEIVIAEIHKFIIGITAVKRVDVRMPLIIINYKWLVEIMLLVFMDIPAVGSVLAETLGSPVVANYCFFILSYLNEFLLAVSVVAERPSSALSVLEHLTHLFLFILLSSLISSVSVAAPPYCVRIGSSPPTNNSQTKSRGKTLSSNSHSSVCSIRNSQIQSSSPTAVSLFPRLFRV